ncbi:MAG: amino acid racemase [Desulfurococcales archaeon]|nr:amino acid racemase [Desulfurococcales archaeon]
MAWERLKHVGIVAVSAPGAALCYQTICTVAEEILGKKYVHPEVSMHGYPFSMYMELIDAGDWEGVAELMASSARKLASLGADFIVCPDNTVHIAFDIAVEKSPIPWLHIAEEVAREAKRRGFKKLLVLGTRYLMELNVYPSRLGKYGIEWAIPDKEAREIVNEIIFNELVYGIVRPESRRKLVKIIEEAVEKKGCDAVVLGCTELPLILNNQVSPIPTLDSTRILAEAAIREAAGLNE